MLAMGYDNPGKPETLRQAVVPRPVPLPTELLVRVEASSINPVDWRTRAGAPTPAAMAQSAGFHVLGWDVSGVVESTGPGVHLFAPGDEVFGLPLFPRPAGANSEFVCAPSRHFVKKPAALDHVHAAALPLAGLTAWQALTETVSIEKGHRVLVHAAGGGVGHLAVQIAKHLGAYVIGTASEPKHAWLKSLGVDQLIDYRTERFEDVLEPVDVVLDLVGGFLSDVTDRSLDILKPGGTLIRVAPGTSDGLLERAASRGICVTPEILVEPDCSGLLSLSALVESGQLKVEVEQTYPLSRLAEAHRRGEEDRARGKIVITHSSLHCTG
jgi:NADPH:quinone reductase-like Zn-dependent oxidoreductase